MSSLGVNIAPPYFAIQNRLLGQKVLKTHANIK